MAYQQSQRKFTRLEAPTTSEGEYGPMCHLPTGKYNTEWKFGLAKAKAAIKYIKFIKEFVDKIESPPLFAFEGDPEVEKLIAERKAQIYAEGGEEARMLRIMEKAFESKENYEDFENGKLEGY